jgi:hypothetical protein
MILRSKCFPKHVHSWEYIYPENPNAEAGKWQRIKKSPKIDKCTE